MVLSVGFARDRTKKVVVGGCCDVRHSTLLGGLRGLRSEAERDTVGVAEEAKA